MTEHIKIEDWTIEHLTSADDNKMVIPIMRGTINGMPARTDPLLWLDVEEGIAMTEKRIYRLGEPNPIWYDILLNSGHTLEDVEIKETTH